MIHLEGFLETLEGASVDGLIVIDVEQTVQLFSCGAERLFGYGRAEVEGQALSMLLPDRFHAPHQGAVHGFAQGSEPARDVGSKRQVIGRRKSGEEFVLDASIYRFGSPRAPTMAALLREAAPTEHAAAEAMQQLAVIAEAGIGFFSHNHRTGAVFCSEALVGLLSIAQGPLQYVDLAETLGAGEMAWFLDAANGAYSKAEERTQEHEHVFTDMRGEKRCVALRTRTQWAPENGRMIRSRTVGVVRDVTQRRLREDHQRFLLALADMVRRESRPESVLKVACQALCDYLGADRVIYTDIEGENFITRECHQRGGPPFPDQGKVAGFGAAFLAPYLDGKVIAVGDCEIDPRVTAPERDNFRRAGIAAFAGVMLVKDGVCLGALGAHRYAPHRWRMDERDLLNEVVERVWSASQALRAQRALALSEARMRAAFESSSAGFCETDPETGAILRCNTAFASLIGTAAIDLVGQPLADLMHPSDRSDIELGYSRLRGGDFDEFRTEKRFLRSDGKAFIADLTANLARDGDGQAMLAVTFMRDVTEAVRNRQDLALAMAALETRVAERTRDLETAMRRQGEALEALARAQRLEAIGRLTGGVVHDSNNMLTLIAGNLEMMEDLGPSDQMQRHMREAQGAVEKMRQLNRRLLTFARKRRLEPAALDLNAHIAAMSDMLTRVLGAGVSLSISLADAPCAVLADAVEVDNAILNLAINARDAMPDGGAIHVTTDIVDLKGDEELSEEGLAPGRYCVVTVADTGAGIPKDVLPHVWEPFFTTKSTGLGTGLGLATVYGFMKQSGGVAAIESEVGEGTAVKLYFPSVSKAPSESQSSKAGSIALGGGELVLVVEDDPQVRRLTVERLKRLGYVTQEAPDGPTALAVLGNGGPIALVFSDVVLPGGMSGFDLAERVAQQWPERRVLLTSGFDMGLAGNGSAAGERWRLLQKPYDQAALARAVRSALQT